MMVHAAENLYIPYLSGNEENLVTIASDTNRFWIAFWNGGIARTCVPLFMIASAFLLVPVKQGVTMTAFYKRRFLRIIPPTAAFLVLYAVIPPLYGAFSWEQAWTYLKQIPFNFPDNAGHLWFMYPLISLNIHALPPQTRAYTLSLRRMLVEQLPRDVVLLGLSRLFSHGTLHPFPH